MKTPVLPLLSASGERVASRRDVLRLLGLAAAAAAVPLPLRAGTNSWLTAPDYAPAVWKDRITIFVREVLPYEAIPAVLQYLDAAPYARSAPTCFHDGFSSPIRFVLRLEPLQTRYAGATFELDQLPYYDRQNPCRRTKDLNAPEIARLIEPSERRQYGCVMSPCSPRRELTADDHELYKETAREYRFEPSDYTPQYVRNFSDGKGSYIGVGATRNDWASPQLPPKNVFLSSLDVS